MGHGLHTWPPSGAVMWRTFERDLENFLATEPSREALVSWIRNQLTARILYEETHLAQDELVALIRTTPIE